MSLFTLNMHLSLTLSVKEVVFICLVYLNRLR